MSNRNKYLEDEHDSAMSQKDTQRPHTQAEIISTTGNISTYTTCTKESILNWHEIYGGMKVAYPDPLGGSNGF